MATLVEVRERVALAAVVTLLALLLPALLRRSVRTWRGRYSDRRDGILDAPFHRDPLFWLAALLFVGGVINAGAWPSLDHRSSFHGAGVPLTETYVVGRSYVWTLLALGLHAAAAALMCVLFSVGRMLYRRLGQPRHRATTGTGAPSAGTPREV